MHQYISLFIEVTDNAGRINLLHANCEIKKEGHQYMSILECDNEILKAVFSVAMARRQANL
jgi:hypothetical protein